MRVVDAFVQQCRQAPAKRALRILSSQSIVDEWTWGELERLMHETAARMQRQLADQPLQVGDAVATWLPNGLAWILVDLASQWMGWVHVALDLRLSHAMASELVKHSRARLLVLSDEHTLHFASLVPTLSTKHFELADTGRTEYSASSNIDDCAPAQLLYTSGTISRPKGALLSHRNLLSNAQAKLLAAPQFATDVRMNILPFAHAYARTCELSTWILSGSELCIANDWSAFIKWAPQIQPTLINLVPHLVYRLIERLDDSSADEKVLGGRLRLLQVGGAALRADTWQRLATLGWPPLQGYGLTETSPVICSNRAGQQRHDTVGRPVEGVEIRIDSDGVLWTRGPHVMLGYWRNAEAMQEKFCDGWFCTGDLAEQLSDGSLRIVGRIDDQITLSTGYKVAPLDLTARLADDPWVDQVVLVGQDRPFVAALIYPRQACPIDGASLPTAMVERWRTRTSDLPRSMQIERVAVMKEPLTVDNGGLNFKGAVRRKFVEQTLCREEVERIYSSIR